MPVKIYASKEDAIEAQKEKQRLYYAGRRDYYNTMSKNRYSNDVEYREVQKERQRLKYQNNVEYRTAKLAKMKGQRELVKEILNSIK